MGYYTALKKECTGRPCNEKMIETNSVEIYNEDNKFDSLFYNDVIRFIVACNKLFKREIFDTICFPKGRYYEDSFIAHHIIDKVSKMVYTDEVLYYYRLRKGSITSKYDIKRLDDLDAMKDRMNLFNEKYKNTKYADLSIILYYDMLIRVYCNFIYYKKNLKDYKSVVKKLKSEYDINYKRIIKISNSKWKRMKYWLFKYFPNIYYFVIYRYRIIRKGATNW